MAESQKSEKTHREVLVDRLNKLGYSEEEVNGALKAWETTKTLLPKTFDEINASDVCYFCKKEKRDKHVYAHIVLAHEEPVMFKRTILSFGKKNVKAQIGSLVPVDIPVCKRCKKVFRMISLIKWLVAVGVLAVGFAVNAVLNGLGVFNDDNAILAYVILLVAAIGGYIIGKVISAGYARKKSDEVYLDIFDIPVLEEMKEKGWFLLQDNSTSSALMFKKTPEDFGKVF